MLAYAVHDVVDFVGYAAVGKFEGDGVGRFDGDDLPASVAVKVGVRVDGAVLADVAEQIFGDRAAVVDGMDNSFILKQFEDTEDA